MSWPRSRIMYIVVLGVLLAVASSHGTASANEPDTARFTTRLYPGWNMTAWLGPSAPASELFGAVPALERAFAWDPAAGRYRRLAPGGTGDLAPGLGLWLYIDGTATVQWPRPVYEDGRLVLLRRGSNLVGWTGRDGVPLEGAITRLGEAVAGVTFWNATTQAYERYRPGADDGAAAPRSLRHGEAFWLELSAEARWWQPGTATTPLLVFRGGVPPDEQAALRAEFKELEAFFAERFGTGSADYTVYVRGFQEEAPPYTCLQGVPPEALSAALPCRDPIRWYMGAFHFQKIQERLAPRAGPYVPGPDGVHPQGADWLHRGTQRYAEYDYLRSVEPERARELRGRYYSYASAVGGSLRGLESLARTDYLDYQLDARGFFAAEWLAERAGAPALLDYYRVIRSSRDWRHAFERTFGMEIGRFYELVEPHLDEIAPPFPHLSDEEAEPVLALLGEITPGAASAVRRDFEAAQQFFGERLGADGADYTVYVAADDESAAPAFRKAFGEDPDPGFCFTASQSSALVMTLDCGLALRDRLGRYHYLNVLGEIQRSTGRPLAGPWWLRVGWERFVREGYRAVAGGGTLEEVRSGLADRSRSVGHGLDSLEEGAPAAISAAVARDLAHLAADRLAWRAGEGAIVEYLRQRSPSEPWPATFERVFGLAVADFYREFDVHRVR